MKSREERQREAWYWGAGAIGACAVLLVFYALFEGLPDRLIGVAAALIGVTGALGGVALGSQLARYQRRQEDRQRRRVLATMFLSELQSLEEALREACQHEFKTESIRLAQTATYDQAGAHLLLFSPDTVQALIGFYQQVPKVQALARAWNADRQLLGPIHEQLQQSGIAVLQALPEVVTRLCNDEQGEWPRKVPASVTSRPFWDELPPPVF